MYAPALFTTTATATIIMDGAADAATDNLPTITAADGMGKLAEAWLAQLDVAASTKATYRRNVAHYVGWLRAHGITGYPTRADVVQYKAEQEGAFATSTIKSRMSTVKSLHAFAAAEFSAADPAAHVKTATGKADESFKRDYLTEGQVARTLRGIDRSTLAGRRDYAMIALMVTAGLRTIEIARADIGDIRTMGGARVLYVHGKGRSGKDAFVKIAPEVDAAIASYIKARREAGEHIADASPLFVPAGNRRADGGRMTTRSISRIAKEAMKAAGIDDARHTAHSLRHTTATLALLDGAPIEEVQAALRHRSISTTLIYAHHLSATANTTASRVAGRIFQ